MHRSKVILFCTLLLEGHSARVTLGNFDGDETGGRFLSFSEIYRQHVHFLHLRNSDSLTIVVLERNASRLFVQWSLLPHGDTRQRDHIAPGDGLSTASGWASRLADSLLHAGILTHLIWQGW